MPVGATLCILSPVTGRLSKDVVAHYRVDSKEVQMGYLVAAYAVLWAISFGLVASIVVRQRRLQSELAMLRVMVEDEAAPE
jgi:hypothetical protein